MLTFHYEKKNIYQFNHGASLQNQLLTKYPQSHLKSLCSSIKCTRIHLSCRSNILSALDMSCSIAQRNADRQWQHPSVGAWPGRSHTHQAAPSCPGSSAASFILRPMTCKKKQCVFSPPFLRRGKDFLHTPSCSKQESLQQHSHPAIIPLITVLTRRLPKYPAMWRQPIYSLPTPVPVCKL